MFTSSNFSLSLNAGTRFTIIEPLITTILFYKKICLLFMNDLLFTKKYILACAVLLIILLIRTEVLHPNTRKKITVTLLEEYISIQVCNMCGSAHTSTCTIYQTGLNGATSCTRFCQIFEDMLSGTSLYNLSRNSWQMTGGH